MGHLPTALFLLTELERMNLSNNVRMERIIPEELAVLENLKEIQVDTDEDSDEGDKMKPTNDFGD